MNPKLSRRQALGLLATSAALTTLPRQLRAAGEEPKPVRVAAYRHSVCRWCYKGMPLETLVNGAKEIGIESVELLSPRDWPLVRDLGLTCAIANGTTTIPKGFNRTENHLTQVPSMIERIRACGEAGLPNVICFSGNRAGMSAEEGLENCAVGLKQIVGEAEKAGVTICMELLNSKIDHRDYMCDNTAWGVELVKRVGSERFKLLYDIYHMQIMEGDVINTIRTQSAYIGHYHTGGVPGRHEIDDAQELNYPAIMRAIAATGFKGFVGQEFIPARDPLKSLREAVEICRV